MDKRILVAALVSLGFALMAPARRSEDFGDAIGNFNFRVEIDGVAIGSFTGVDGLSVEQEVVEYREGSDDTVRKLPGRLKWGDITLKRGFRADSSLSSLVGTEPGGVAPHVLVTLADGRGRELRRWHLTACFPSRWELASVPAAPNGTRLEERLALACDRFTDDRDG
jgi:phage tail-like protein